MRYKELDSLRGLAALTVLFAHIITLFYRNKPGFLESTFKYWIDYTPFRVFFSAHEAVIFFFILSGFVLSLQFYSTKPFGYMKFITKRITRIYIPYLVAVFLAIWLVYKGEVANKDVIGHILFIGNYNYDAFMGIVWSLTHEMRISIIFPILMIFFLTRTHWLSALSVALVFTSIASYLYLHHPYFDNALYLINFYSSIHYISMFMLGALLAKHRQEITRFFVRISTINKIATLMIGLMLYINLANQLQPISEFISDWVSALGASIFIITSLSFKKLSGFLLLRPIQFIGKISYSLYLTHIIVLFLLLKHYEMFPTHVLSLIAICFSIISATIMHYTVEVPSIYLGKFLTKRKVIGDKQIKSKTL
ncbi:acyltransferase family protein [Paenibacillus tundrae]